MPILIILPIVALFAAFIAQQRFVDSYMKSIGGPTRRQRQQLVLSDFPAYWKLLQQPPFTLRSWFTSFAVWVGWLK